MNTYNSYKIMLLLDLCYYRTVSHCEAFYSGELEVELRRIGHIITSDNMIQTGKRAWRLLRRSEGRLYEHPPADWSKSVKSEVMMTQFI